MARRIGGSARRSTPGFLLQKTVSRLRLQTADALPREGRQSSRKLLTGLKFFDN